MADSCQRQVITFKTARGRSVLFRGRPGGSRAHGGRCAPVRASSAQKAAQSALARAARSCAGGTFKQVAACVARKLTK